jgi:hemolysin activation/secretion protein
MSVPETARFLVKGFHISRITAFSESDLLPLLKDFVDQELSLSDLLRAAEVINRYYRDHGYFVARAYIPEQDIKDGIVEIIVLEGKVDRISVKTIGDVRLHESIVEDTLKSALTTGGLIHKDKLERGLLLLNDLPGVKVTSVLSPGSKVGTSLLTTEVTQGPRLTGNVDFDNYGNKFSGAMRVGAGINLNDALGRGDQISLRVTDSSGLRHGRVAYQTLVGTSGLKMGGAYSAMNYDLCCDFAPLNAHGSAQVASANAFYPIIRGMEFSLYGIAFYDHRHFLNSTINGTTSDKKVDVGRIGLQGDGRDFVLGGGMNSFDLTLHNGNVNLNGLPADRVADSTTAATNGSYQKFSYSLVRLQKIADRLSFYTAFSGQIASKNLDTSEKISLGGPMGVRAYPQGEAFSDEIMLLNLELRYQLTQSLQIAPFFDHGEARLHHNTWSGWQSGSTTIQNRYGLSGYGVGLNWSIPGNFAVRFGVAQRIGTNPGRGVNGLDADSAKQSPRVWIMVVKNF